MACSSKTLRQPRDTKQVGNAQWADGLKERAHVNVAAVAMANKMARIAWAVLTKGERYRPAALVGA